jgi:hypothetical protein
MITTMIIRIRALSTPPNRRFQDQQTCIAEEEEEVLELVTNR